MFLYAITFARYLCKKSALSTGELSPGGLCRNYNRANTSLAIHKFQTTQNQLSKARSFDSPQQSSRCNLNIEKFVHFFKIAKICQTITLVCFITFKQPMKFLKREINILSIPSYCGQSEIYEVTLYFKGDTNIGQEMTISSF